MKWSPFGVRALVKLLLVTLPLVTGAVSLFAGKAAAEDFRIAAFDGTRSYRPFLSDSRYEDIRGTDFLLNPAFFGPGGVVDRSIQFETALSDARDTGSGNPLASVDMLIMTEVEPLDWDPAQPNNPTTAAEQAEYQAIAQFVRGGGCLVVTVDTLPLSLYGTKDLPNPWVNMANGVLGAIDGGTGKAGRVGSLSTFGSGGPTEGSLVDYSEASRVLHGAFPYLDDGSVTSSNTETGDLSTVRLGASEQYDLAAGDWSNVIAKRRPPNSTRDLIMEIPLDTIAPGAGAVLVAGDAVFLDDFVHAGYPSPPPYPLQNRNNARILMNFVAQQAVPVPEPSAILLLVSGAVAVGFGMGIPRLVRRKSQP